MRKTDEERQADRLEAIEWARSVLADSSAVILDVETSKKPSAGRENEICEVAVLGVDGQVQYDELVRPAGRIESGCTGLHGISDAMVAGRPRFREKAYAELGALLEGRRVVSYNVEFDRQVLVNEVSRHLGDAALAEQWASRALWEDAMLPYSRWIGEWDPRRGEYRWQRQPGSGHRALADCYTTLGLLHMMAKAAPQWRPPMPQSPETGRAARASVTPLQIDWIHDLLFDLRDVYPTKKARSERISEITGNATGRLSHLSSAEASQVIDVLRAELRPSDRSKPITKQNQRALNIQLSRAGIPPGAERHRALERILTAGGVPFRKITSSADLTEGEFELVMKALRADSERPR